VGTTVLRLRRWASPAAVTAVAGVIVCLAGPVILIGRWLDHPSLAGALPGLPKTAPSGALGLALAGVALGVLRTEHASRGRRRFAVACASGVSFIGAAALLGSVSGWDAGIDRWLANAPAAAGGKAEPCLPSFHTALVLVLIGPALLLLDARPRRGPQPGQFLALVAVHILLLALLGHAFGNRVLYVTASPHDGGMSVAAALLGLLVSVGTLGARPDAGFTAVLRSAGGGGDVARRLLLVPVVIPLVTGLLIAGAQRAGLIGRGFSGWLFAVAYFTAFTFIIWWVASVVRRAEAERARAEDDVRRLNEELERRVLERTAQLGEANRDLAHKNRENELFVYSVSHDLRSPLVNLQGFSKELEVVCQEVHALLEDDRLPAELRRRGQALIDGDMTESLRFIQTAVLRLGTIIDALLRLSRAGRVQYHWQSVDLTGTVGRVVEALRSTIGERGAAVTVHELPPAWGDPVALEQLFANLIGNAVNYLDPERRGAIEVGGDVPGDTLGCVRSAGWSTYYVKDNGLGIPEAHLSKVFQAFQRLHPDSATGEGIGLTIVHRIVERHGGKVWLTSAPGVGTTFFVVLPNTAAAHGRGLQA
jgi:signal transduction histidine kinase